MNTRETRIGYTLYKIFESSTVAVGHDFVLFFIPNVQQDEQTFQVKFFKKSTSTNFSCITTILCFNDTSENAQAALFYTFLAKTSGNMDSLTSNTQKQKQILENTNIHVLEETGSKHMLYVYVILTSSLTSTS